jgi:hypothetical protein
MPILCLDRFRMNISCWNTSGTPCLIAALTQIIDQSFSHHGTAGITRTVDQDFRRSGLISRSTQWFFQRAHSNQVAPLFPAYSTHRLSDWAGRRIAGHPPSSGMLPTECRRDLVSMTCPAGHSSRRFRLPQPPPCQQLSGGRATLSAGNSVRVQ